MQLCNSLNTLWHCLSSGLEWKLTFSSPVATAEFSKFAGILSAVLSQHHLLGFEIAQLNSLTSTGFAHSDGFQRPTWLHIPGCLALGEWSHPCDYLDCEDLFCIVILYILATSSLDHQKSKRVADKHLLLLYWLCQSLWLCGLELNVENSSRDGNTRPPDLPLEKSVCRSGSNS